MKRGSAILFAILTILALLLFAIDMMVGSVGIAARDVWAALTGGECDPVTRKIILVQVPEEVMVKPSLAFAF